MTSDLLVGACTRLCMSGERTLLMVQIQGNI